jgi:hypothetical protein
MPTLDATTTPERHMREMIRVLQDMLDKWPRKHLFWGERASLRVTRDMLCTGLMADALAVQLNDTLKAIMAEVKPDSSQTDKMIGWQIFQMQEFGGEHDLLYGAERMAEMPGPPIVPASLAAITATEVSGDD